MLALLPPGLRINRLFAAIAGFCVIGFPVATYSASADQVWLERSAQGEVQFKTDRISGTTDFVRLRGAGDLMPSVSADKGRAFLREHGHLFGLINADAELSEMSDRGDAFGYRTITYQQVHEGVPVFGARLKTSFNSDGALTSVNGKLAQAVSVNVTPFLSAVQAQDRAVSHLRRMAVPQDLGVLTPSSGELYVYNAGMIRHRAGRNQLVYEILVTGEHLREFIYVDAHNGKIADQITGIYDDIERRIYDGGFGPGFLEWSEGESTPTASEAWDNLIDYSLDIYNLVSSITDGDYLSWDGNDGIMHAVNNDPAVRCPNAQFTGSYIRFCDGTTTDDIVGHEWFHGYTQETHGLIYMYQSGAMNEAYSDIFGEVVDILNGAGTDSPNAQRAAGSCSVYGGKSSPSLTVSSPAEVAGDYLVGGAEFNPVSAPVSAEVANADPNNACSTVAGSISGRIALVDRGDCPFVEKVVNAQAAGAVGVIIVNNVDDGVIKMAGDSTDIDIPSVFIGQSNGEALKGVATVMATIALGLSTDDSYRWLTGEDSSAFGGAIRDMWNPACFGDPGRVSDPLYYCDAGDSGGVHSNSGIINHGFALLVDGGTYNGQTIQPLGLTKATHLYWRTADIYQTPMSGYTDHAAALQASCADLVDQDLPALNTNVGRTEVSTEKMTAGDCAEVDKVIAALELNESPLQCSFATLLDQDPPDLCAAGEATVAVLDEDFEGGLGAFSVGHRAVVNPATFDVPDWSVVGNLPFGRPGMAAFGADPILGNCTNDIEAGVTYLQSPTFAMPANGRLTFEHSISTEVNFDGGNVKVSVNGGAYALLPASAFSYNAYTGKLSSAQSDNPIRGEFAFHGTDGGTFQSAWGESQVDLTAIASPGDQIELRFEMGTDGCNGVIGWYVDNVRAYSCALIDTDADGDPDTTDPDDDGDGMSDDFEMANSLDPLDWNDAGLDADDDGLTNLEEFNISPQMNPNSPDTDDDGIGDLLDSQPTIFSNQCTGGNPEDHATVTGLIDSDRTCAARLSISVITATEVQSLGRLRLIAPTVTIQSGFSAAQLTVISADPCPSCSP